MSQKPTPDGGFLAKHGAVVIDNGYEVIPIQVGKKAPGFEGWQKSRSSKTQLDEWVEHGHRYSGLGILTTHTPAIDIDVRDDDMAKWVEDFVIATVGSAPVRVGSAPKRLMVCRTDTPFKKMRSGKWVDPEWGQEHQVEILGEGQQFVAFHIHPDTKKPYTWPSGDSPLNVRAPDLVLLTAEAATAICEAFDAKCKESGYTLVKASRTHKPGGASSADNPWAEDSQPVELSPDEIRARTLLVPNPEDHERWVNVGMALYHQFDGGEPGLEIWHEWAETANNYDKDVLEQRWKSFGISGKGRAPLTARFILQLSKEAIEGAAQVLVMELRDAFMQAKDVSEWEKARALVREAEIDGLSRSSLANVAKERRDAITGTKTSLVEVKKALAYTPKKADKAPGWCADFVYDVSDDRFYNTAMKLSASKQGFDAMYDRRALTKKDVLDGKSSPSQSASELALNVFEVQTVAGRRYMPGRDPIYHEPDGTFANTYPEHEIPALPDKLLPRDKRAITRVRNHISHLLKSEREQRMFLDWLSWIVQNPGKHANYAVVLQGVEGDGKSFFGQLMRTVMGVSNVRMLNAHILENSFTDWAVGQCLACIEEIRLVNHTRFEVINRIKPFITNEIIEIHPKGKPVFNAKNTTSYLLFSNYKDALPIDDDSRRYMVLFSQWQRKDLLDAFKDASPDYYLKLYGCLEECGPALRQWLLEHEQTDTFNPLGDAPMTEARKFMVRQAKPEFIQVLDDIIAENTNTCICPELLSISVLAGEMVMRGLDFPSPKTMTAMLQRDGYDSVGRFEFVSEKHSFWSKRIELFQNSDVHGGTCVDAQKVKKWLNKRQKETAEQNEL